MRRTIPFDGYQPDQTVHVEGVADPHGAAAQGVAAVAQALGLGQQLLDLRLGGVVGEGAWIDRTFNTTDVCLILDTARMSERRRAIYAGGER